MPDSIEFSEEKLLNNEWMDLDTAVSIKTASDDGDFAPNTINDTVVGLKNAVRDPIGDPAAPNPGKRMEVSQESLEAAMRAMALMILGLCPESKERNRAIEAIDMAVMWANASIERHVR